MPAPPPTVGGVPPLPSAARPTAAPPPDRGPGRPVAIPPGREFRLLFQGGSEALEPADHELLTGLAARLAAEPDARLRLTAYAGAARPEDRDARRLSLSRAVAVRDYLMSQGIRGTRIDVRAMGARTEGGPPDRVDLVVVN
ncbi:OmpA family protein [Arenibaculum pallidiluteum]|uniref:OmpA family protein n=1 Tax=Arenibaculum pallidiluteum TaxID=2812559 RepID=UPI001A9600F2|nr:OmpA family protein [Arenibaculum pallidiluteum]